jgi:hypothetical protein
MYASRTMLTRPCRLAQHCKLTDTSLVTVVERISNPLLENVDDYKVRFTPHR